MDRGYKVSQTWLWLGIEYYTSCGRCKNSAQGGELGGGEGVGLLLKGSASQGQIWP